jgi:hypothetical protein
MSSGSFEPMASKKDIRQLRDVSREFGMDPFERRESGAHVEDCKRLGEQGSGKNGDFTYDEVREKAREYQGKKS